MTVSRARELLADYGEKLTDKQIMAIIESLSILINIGLEQLESKRSNCDHKEVLQCQKLEPIMKS